MKILEISTLREVVGIPDLIFVAVSAQINVVLIERLLLTSQVVTGLKFSKVLVDLMHQISHCTEAASFQDNHFAYDKLVSVKRLPRSNLKTQLLKITSNQF